MNPISSFVRVLPKCRSVLGCSRCCLVLLRRMHCMLVHHASHGPCLPLLPSTSHAPRPHSFLGKNMISEIGSGLSTLTALESLDLSDNYIETVDGLDGLPLLKTLNLSGNKMRNVADVAHLQACTALTSLDLAGCKLEEAGVVDMLMTKPLALLRLQGNPVVSSYK